MTKQLQMMRKRRDFVTMRMLAQACVIHSQSGLTGLSMTAADNAQRIARNFYENKPDPHPVLLTDPVAATAQPVACGVE